MTSLLDRLPPLPPGTRAQYSPQGRTDWIVGTVERSDGNLVYLRDDTGTVWPAHRARVMKVTP